MTDRSAKRPINSDQDLPGRPTKRARGRSSSPSQSEQLSKEVDIDEHTIQPLQTPRRSIRTRNPSTQRVVSSKVEMPPHESGRPPRSPPSLSPNVSDAHSNSRRRKLAPILEDLEPLTSPSLAHNYQIDSLYADYQGPPVNERADLPHISPPRIPSAYDTWQEWSGPAPYASWPDSSLDTSFLATYEEVQDDSADVLEGEESNTRERIADLHTAPTEPRDGVDGRAIPAVFAERSGSVDAQDAKPAWLSVPIPRPRRRRTSSRPLAGSPLPRPGPVTPASLMSLNVEQWSGEEEDSGSQERAHTRDSASLPGEPHDEADGGVLLPTSLRASRPAWLSVPRPRRRPVLYGLPAPSPFTELPASSDPHPRKTARNTKTVLETPSQQQQQQAPQQPYFAWDNNGNPKPAETVTGGARKVKSFFTDFARRASQPFSSPSRKNSQPAGISTDRRAPEATYIPAVAMTMADSLQDIPVVVTAQDSAASSSSETTSASYHDLAPVETHLSLASFSQASLLPAAAQNTKWGVDPWSSTDSIGSSSVISRNTRSSYKSKMNKSLLPPGTTFLR